MKNITVIYWSGTGNTQMMAEAIEKGATGAGAQVKLLSVDQASLEDITGADAVALGCPSMGAEVLEEEEMEPFVEGLEGKVTGKAMGLFGSYGWGNGEWMDDWVSRMEGYGANLAVDSLILNETPDEDGLEKCRDFGADLAK